MKKNKYLAIISALAVLAGGAGAAHAQNLVANGDFTANAAAFATSPGYTGGANPAAITSWGNIIPGLVGVNGAATPLGNIFGPVNAGGHNYAFIQGGVVMLGQNLPVSYTPNKMYELSFDAAARNGNPSVSFRVQIGDATQTHVTTQVGGVDVLIGKPAAFTHYSYTFTSPATFDGAPSIQLYNLTVGDNTINFANVSLVASPEAVRTNVLTDTFNTPDTFDLDADLATRESGLRHPSPNISARKAA